MALSEVSLLEISHDAISRWLSEKHFRPRDLWLLAKDQINPSEPCLLIADDIHQYQDTSDQPQEKKNKLDRAKIIVTEVRKLEKDEMPIKAENTIKKLIPE